MLRPLLVLLFAVSLPLQAQQPSAPAGQVDAQAIAAERVWRNYQQRTAVLLAASGQPRDLALAAVLHDVANMDPEGGIAENATTTGWRQAAAQQAGADVIANSMLMMGAEAGGALREQAARRWAQAEPDNIAPLLLLDGGAEMALARARDLRRFDLHMYDQVRWIQSALLRHPPSAAERSVLMGQKGTVEELAADSAMALWAAVALPSLQPLTFACSDGTALRSMPARAADCAQIARVLVGFSDSGLGRMMGIGMLERMAGNASERAEVQALLLRMNWQMSEWGRIASSQERDGLPQFVRLLADPQVRTEQDLIERVLAEAGVPLDPPAGWQPPRR
ncbi:hypothetical protein WCE55_04400 [Luteimonas sp. MJ293]|uniref:hypothetical protein n=1 Tax=Luteimonas sp. MJ146 TaxID=3129240 RepID=UPI0031B9E067